MGGGLSLLGEPGRGTKVRVWVDLGHEGQPHPANAALRVLLQDPDPVSSLVVVKLLEKAGHRVDFVTTVAEAKNRIDGGTYDVLLTEAPPSSPEAGETLRNMTASGRLRLVGLYPLGSGSPREIPLWTATLAKPVTFLALEGALSRCRPPEGP
jgi:hypothetical protein